MVDNEDLNALLGGEVFNSSDEHEEEIDENDQLIPKPLKTKKIKTEEVEVEEVTEEIPEEEIISFDKNQFSTLMQILGAVSKSCSDVKINKGMICQMSDRRNATFVVDMRTLVGNSTVVISSLETKLMLLQPFQKQQVDVNLKIGKNAYEFYDGYSTIRLIKPLEKYLSNKQVELSSLDKMLAIREDSAIFNYCINRQLLERLKTFSKALSASMLLVEFTNNKAVIKMHSGENTSPTTAQLLSINSDISINGMCVYSIKPFLLETDELTISAHNRTKKGDEGQESILLKIESSMSGVDVKIWCNSPLNIKE